MGDLKPIDLFLASLKPGEKLRVEERTVADLQIARKSPGYRGESPIEMGNSRFRARLLVGRSPSR